MLNQEILINPELSHPCDQSAPGAFGLGYQIHRTCMDGCAA